MHDSKIVSLADHRQEREQAESRLIGNINRLRGQAAEIGGTNPATARLIAIAEEYWDYYYNHFYDHGKLPTLKELAQQYDKIMALRDLEYNLWCGDPVTVTDVERYALNK